MHSPVVLLMSIFGGTSPLRSFELPTSFSNSSNLQFSNVGMTQTLNGLTLSTTIFDLGSGGTAVTSIVPTSLNYVLSSVVAFQTLAITGSFVGVSFGILSLTTNSSRMVEISLLGASTSGYIGVNSPSNSSFGFNFRVTRGPSTGLNNLSALFGASSTVARVPPSSFRWIDFSPPSGAATYILEAATVGASTLVTLSEIQMLVRQI